MMIHQTEEFCRSMINRCGFYPEVTFSGDEYLLEVYYSHDGTFTGFCTTSEEWPDIKQWQEATEYTMKNRQEAKQ